jgi:hypothetical protein
MMLMSRDRAVKLWLVIAVTALALGFAAVARALVPDHQNVSGTYSFVDDTSCAFPIDVSIQYRITFTDLYDTTGAFVGAVVEQNLVGTETANGKTLSETDHYVDHYDALGDDRTSGLSINIRLVSGRAVIRDTGNFQLDADGNVVFVHGPHPLLEGDTAALCAALS